MALPSLPEYNDYVQNPGTAFSDNELRQGKVACNGLGVPIALSGGFAITYRLLCKNRQVAVRCFHKEVRDLETRYAAISDVLAAQRSAIFVDFQYQPAGIRHEQRWFPIVKMDWIDGYTLGNFLEAQYNSPDKVASLRRDFTEVEAALSLSGIAHGDIQNGNIIIGHKLRLIDYDGCYVPGLRVGEGAETGHVHFQHPKRSGSDYGPNMDRFSFILLDLSLRAIEISPALFSRYYNGENILFTGADLRSPNASPLFKELLSIRELATAAMAFQRVCLAPISSIPSLQDFIDNRNIPSVAATDVRVDTQNYVAPYSVLEGTNYENVLRAVGNRVEIIGCIQSVREGKTKRGKSYVFLNLSDWRSNAVKVTIWAEGLIQFQAKPNQSWTGAWVSVTGLIDSPYYSPKYKYRSVGITVSQQSQLHRITEKEARFRLSTVSRPAPTHKQLQSPNYALLNEIKTGNVSNRPLPPPVSKNADILRDILNKPVLTANSQTNASQGSSTGKATTQYRKPPGQGCLVIIAFVVYALVRFVAYS